MSIVGIFPYEKFLIFRRFFLYKVWIILEKYLLYQGIFPPHFIYNKPHQSALSLCITLGFHNALVLPEVALPQGFQFLRKQKMK